jgi:hypothetical protein
VAAAGGAQLPAFRRADVWLAQQPEGGSRAVHDQVWLVVFLAALSAMDYGLTPVAAGVIQHTSMGGLASLTCRGSPGNLGPGFTGG